MLPKFIIYEHGCPSWNVIMLDFYVGDLISLERYKVWAVHDMLAPTSKIKSEAEIENQKTDY